MYKTVHALAKEGIHYSVSANFAMKECQPISVSSSSFSSKDIRLQILILSTNSKRIYYFPDTLQANKTCSKGWV